MTINTNYELNQTVWFLDWRGVAHSGTIKRMSYDEKGLSYWLYVPGIPSPGFYENKLFSTEALALASANVEELTQYYVLSLYHTTSKDSHILLWGPDNAGYVLSKQYAGLYEELTPGYHDSERSMPISKLLADTLFTLVQREGQDREMIPNTPEVWAALGLKADKKEKCLKRIKA
ncbi:hypothetical protein [Spirosoma sp.]|uniref:hypothetical protein n=1 Tax=Spirosoma sp. TaxID=1899569 RepID=UPI00261851EE|nr:hypothetical protein [Spirosoma sp.]MCX6217651.1 hypothetical protein [Spirosoma sp.]